MTDRRIPLGVLLKPHGLKGAVRVHLHDAESQTLRPGLALDLERDGVVVRSVTVKEKRGAGGTSSVQFAGVGTIEEAEALRGLTIVVKRSDLPALDDGEFYVEDILGADVFERGADGELERKGTVAAFERYPSTDVLVVTVGVGEDAKTVEVPLLERFVEAVDVSVPRIVLSAGTVDEVTP